MRRRVEMLSGLLLPLMLSAVPSAQADEAALNYYKSLELDNHLTLSGFVASRTPQESQAAVEDYRTYVGVGYRQTLFDSFAFTGRTFYGAGTYSGDNSRVNPIDGHLPSELSNAGDATGDWLGTDWKVAGKSFNAGLEYRQEAQLRKTDVVAKSEIALAQDLALDTRVRYDDRAAERLASVDPRVELRYKPASDSTVSAVFDQASRSPVSADRAAPLVNLAEDSNRARNYSLAYEQAVSSENKLRVTAFRYGVSGLLADPAAAFDSSLAQIDATGVEVGMERHRASGMRSSISYAYQQTNNLVGGLDQGTVGQHLTKMSVGFPFWARRLSTALELQYHDIVSPLVGQGYDFLVGNLTLASGELSKDTSLSFGVHDTFKTKDEPANSALMPFVPQNGRSVQLNVKRKF